MQLTCRTSRTPSWKTLEFSREGVQQAKCACPDSENSTKIEARDNDILTARSCHWDILCLLPACDSGGILGCALETRRPEQSGGMGPGGTAIWNAGDLVPD